MTTTLLSGDQGILWDAPLKLKVLQHRGIPVMHEIHSADQFSRTSEAPSVPSVIREHSLSHGQRSIWSSGMKTAPFLGRILVDPRKATNHFGNLKQIPDFEHRDGYRKIFTSDTWGVGIPQGERCIQGIGFGEVRSCFNTLRGKIRDNLEATLINQPVSTELWGGLFDLVRYLPSDRAELDALPLGEVWRRLIAGWIPGLSVTTSFARFQSSNGSTILRAFAERYAVVGKLYNETAKHHGMSELNLESQELPYFRVEDWRRVSLTLAHEREKGEVRIPKAIPLLVETLEAHPIVLPEHGSVYSPASAQFLRGLRNNGYRINCHPVWRVKYNALDNLAGLSFQFRLPEYLRRHFGTEVISAADFASFWRAVVAQAESRLGEISSMNGNRLADHLVSIGRLSDAVRGRMRDLTTILSERRSIPDRDILSAEADFLRARVQERKLEYIVELLQVIQGLPVWNDRPYYWWVALVDPSGSWEQAILEKAEIYQEPVW